MKRFGAVVLAVLVLLSASAVPGDAWTRSGGRGGHSGSWHGSGWHGGGWRGGCCWGGWWWPGAVVGGLAVGAAVASAYSYPYAYSYPSSYPYYYPYAPSAVGYQEVYVAPQAPPVQREVVYENGKYVLYGDGVTQRWQWVWVPAAPPAPPPPR